MNTDKKSFDAWRLAEIIVQLATPLTVAIIALMFNFSESSRDQRNKLEQERIARYALIPAFMDALTGPDLTKRDLAVRSVTAILGEDGETLLAGLPTDQVAILPLEAQRIVNDASNARAGALVNNLYSSDLKTRMDAYRDLLLAGPRSEVTIPFILNAASKNQDDLRGVHNSLEYLAHADQEGISKWASEIENLLNQIEPIGPETRALSEEVRARLVDGTF